MNKRGDDADISFLDNVDRPYKSETYFGKSGNQVDENASFCKVLVVGKWEKYFVWMWRNELYDPYGSDILKRDRVQAKLSVVSKETFVQYLRYLKTKNKLYFTRARRLNMEPK